MLTFILFLYVFFPTAVSCIFIPYFVFHFDFKIVDIQLQTPTVCVAALACLIDSLNCSHLVAAMGYNHQMIIRYWSSMSTSVWQLSLDLSTGEWIQRKLKQQRWKSMEKVMQQFMEDWRKWKKEFASECAAREKEAEKRVQEMQTQVDALMKLVSESHKAKAPPATPLGHGS